jgi:ADP-ribose pyrophosphatase
MKFESEKKTGIKVNFLQTVYHGKLFRLLRENVTLTNGATVDMEIVRHPGAAGIVPLLRTDSLVLLKQYRHSVNSFIWEIPAGTLDPHETPLACARRELIEETGFSAHKWEKIGELTPLPGYSDERIHLFLASDLSPAEQNLDKDELVDVHEMPLEKALRMIEQGVIQDGKTISALHLTSKRLERWPEMPVNDLP